MKTLPIATFAIAFCLTIQASLPLARAIDFQVEPGTFPAPSSVGVELTALNSSDDASSSLSGFATIDLKWTSEQEVSQATIADMVLELDDEVELSLLLGAFSATVEPGATRVRMVEPGISTPVEDGQFDQTENTFIFEGEILLNDEVYDVSNFGEIDADLNDVQVLVTEDYVATEARIDLEFQASITVIPVTIEIVGSASSTHYFGDANGDGTLDAEDIDLLAAALRDESTDAVFDVNRDGAVNEQDYDALIEDRLNTFYGDSNLDGLFDSGDFVFVFQRGQYEDNVPMNSGWADGDWNGDQEFDSGDLVTAFQAGGFDAGPRAALAVPEPNLGLWTIGCCLLGLGWLLRGARTGASVGQ